MVGVALYFRFCIMYTSALCTLLFIYITCKKKACGLVVSSPVYLTRERLKGLL